VKIELMLIFNPYLINRICFMESQEYVLINDDAERGVFYKKTYLHVALSILAFIVLETLLIKLIPYDFIVWMVSGKFIWLFLLGCFWLGSTLSSRWTLSQSRQTQYLGLAFYIVLEAIIFLPMIFMAVFMTEGISVIYQASIMTLALFTGLTVVAFVSNKDFSFLRNILVIGGFLSLGAIVAGAIFGFELGLWFSVAMIALASGSILYQTQNLKYNYGNEQYVGAALQLFSSIMLLFWYILRILMRRR